MLTFYEWWYYSHGDIGYLSEKPVSEDQKIRAFMRNATFLADMSIMDWGLSPTAFQHKQLPRLFRDKVDVLHDGIDTDFMAPDPAARFTVGDKTFTRDDEVVTYSTRGMEPYRGFPQFMEALARVQKTRPRLQAVIVGRDRVAYGPQRTDGKTYKQEALEKFGLDQSRIHFTDLVPYSQLRALFQVSSLHIYFTVPFVLSWSMLEAMSCGVLLLGSDTEPVREIVTDGRNGLLVDFRDPKRIARRMEEALNLKEKAAPLRREARLTIERRYAAKHLLPCHRNLILEVASGRKTCR
jgi:glycosyltransferase involved in cell wall biosynthesis